MLDDAPSFSKKTSVLIRIATDLPVSICTEHFLTIGDSMNTQNNQRIRLSTGVGAALLLGGMVPPVYNRTQIALGNFNGGLHAPVYLLVATLLPLLALLLSGIALYTLKGTGSNAFFRRGRPLMIVSGIAVLYLSIVWLYLHNPPSV
jgi:hypothetical protein